MLFACLDMYDNVKFSCWYLSVDWKLISIKWSFERLCPCHQEIKNVTSKDWLISYSTLSFLLALFMPSLSTVLFVVVTILSFEWLTEILSPIQICQVSLIKTRRGQGKIDKTQYLALKRNIVQWNIQSWHFNGLSLWFALEHKI